MNKNTRRICFFFNILGKFIKSGVYQVLFYDGLRNEGTRDCFSSLFFMLYIRSSNLNSCSLCNIWNYSFNGNSFKGEKPVNYFVLFRTLS